MFVVESWATPTGEWDGGEGTGQGVRQPAWAAREEEDVVGVGRKERNFKIQMYTAHIRGHTPVSMNVHT